VHSEFLVIYGASNCECVFLALSGLQILQCDNIKDDRDISEGDFNFGDWSQDFWLM
jgi:hypothetical protein